MQVDLGRYDNAHFDPGGSLLRRTLWYALNALLLNAAWLPLSAPKCWLLRAFGARIGRDVVIKPCVNIKYPWNLVIGDRSWIGEGVWLDNLVPVAIGAHVCISQGAMLLTGNHDYKDPGFGLVTAPIEVRDGAWIGARALIAPGVVVGEHAVVAAGAVLTRNGEPFGVYQGNPAGLVRRRQLRAAACVG
jgi:putative colanic acid biosynthesis acetyltransferase WcaF